jgi:hypothetical protein
MRIYLGAGRARRAGREDRRASRASEVPAPPSREHFEQSRAGKRWRKARRIYKRSSTAYAAQNAEAEVSSQTELPGTSAPPAFAGVTAEPLFPPPWTTEEGQAG